MNIYNWLPLTRSHFPKLNLKIARFTFVVIPCQFSISSYRTCHLTIPQSTTDCCSSHCESCRQNVAILSCDFKTTWNFHCLSVILRISTDCRVLECNVL